MLQWMFQKEEKSAKYPYRSVRQLNKHKILKLKRDWKEKITKEMGSVVRVRQKKCYMILKKQQKNVCEKKNKIKFASMKRRAK